jgi:hypothetical protein
MGELEQAVQEYNELVREWNSEYGYMTEAMPVESDKFKDTYRERVRKLVTDGMSERRKISITITVIGDYQNVNSQTSADGLGIGELAHLIVNAGEDILRIL